MKQTNSNLQSARQGASAKAHLRSSTIRNPLFAFLVAAIAFAIYIRTLAPSIFWGDGIELSAVCATGGIAHPTGYPLFTILGRLFCFAFSHNPAYGTNLLCALLGAIAVAFFFLALRGALKILPADRFLRPHYADITAAAGALLLAFSRTFWFHSTITEVYALHLFFITILIWLFLRFVKGERCGHFYAFFGVWGLSFSNHILSITVLPLAAVMVWIFLRKPMPGRPLLKTFVIAALLFLAGLLPYLYLPLRAAGRPALNWGAPSTLKNFLWIVSGGDFKKYQFLMERPGVPFTSHTFGIHIVRRSLGFARWLVGEIYRFPLYTRLLMSLVFAATGIFVLWGAVVLFVRKCAVGIALVSFVALGILMTFLYNIPDIEPYFMSFYPAILILGILGLIEAIHLLEMRLFGRNINFLPYLFFALPLIALTSHYRAEDKSNNIDALEYGVTILRYAPQRSIIITFGDNDIYALWYLKEARRLRPDVTVVGANFIHSGWYASHFENRPHSAPRFTIKGTSPPSSKGDFLLDLMLWVINPNLGKYPILLTATDPLLDEIYDIRLICQPLEEAAYERAPDSFLPTPYLFGLYKKR